MFTVPLIDWWAGVTVGPGAVEAPGEADALGLATAKVTLGLVSVASTDQTRIITRVTRPAMTPQRGLQMMRRSTRKTTISNRTMVRLRPDGRLWHGGHAR